MESIFCGHQSLLAKDVEKPEGHTIYPSLQDGINKDVLLDTQLKSELVIKNFLSLGYLTSSIKRNLSLRKKEVFLKLSQALNFSNLLKWIGLKLDYKFAAKDSTCWCFWFIEKIWIICI